MPHPFKMTCACACACGGSMSARCATALLAIAASHAPASAAPPSGAFLTVTCQSNGLVSTFDCPQLDPAKGKLVAIDASLYGQAVFSLVATAPSPGQAAYVFNGTHSIDYGGGALYFPVKGEGSVQVGPDANPPNPGDAPQITVSGNSTQTQAGANVLAKFTGKGTVHFTSIADPGKVTVSGASVQQVAMLQARTSVTLVYRYVPTIGKITIPKLPPQHLPNTGPKLPGSAPN